MLSRVARGAVRGTKLVKSERVGSILAEGSPTGLFGKTLPRLASSKASFMREAFFGRIDDNALFPFPSALSAERRDELEQMADVVSKFMKEQVDSVAIDENHEIPKETLTELGAMGLFGMQIAEEYGGLGFNNTEYARLVESIVADASIAVTLMAHQSIGLKGIILFGTDEQKKKYLPKLASGEEIAAFALTEPGAGSDAAGIETRAKLSEDGKHYILNGSKLWISNGGICDVYTMFARTPSPEPGKKDPVTAFIVEKRFGGITPGKPESKLGIRGSNTVELAIEDCKVPVENVLGEVGGGFKVAMEILNNGRFGLGAGAGGAIKELLGMILDHATTRKQFGRPLASFGMVQEMLSNMSISAYAAESMAYSTTGLIDSKSMDMSIEAAMCKIYGSEAMWKVVNDCIQIAGGIGFMSGRHALPYERFMRDARILQIFEGTNQILRLFISLTCLRAVGDDLNKFQKEMSSPANWATGAPRIMAWVQQRLGMGGAEGGSIASRVCSELKSEAAEVDKLVGLLGDVSRRSLIKYKKDIIEQQLLLGRIADLAIETYAATTSMSRATTSKANGTSGEDWERELRLAKAVARQSIRRAKAAYEAAIAEPGSLGNTDDLVAKISEDAVALGGYTARHPLLTTTNN